MQAIMLEFFFDSIAITHIMCSIWYPQSWNDGLYWKFLLYFIDNVKSKEKIKAKIKINW